MYEDMALTRQLGQAYREDKPGSLRALEEWSKQARTEQTDAAEAWEKDVRSDPKAMKEMEAAGKVYAQEMGYDLDDDPPQSEDRTYVYLNFAPYPYWFGYPYWFAYPYWRPYPYWYNTGFYWGVGGIYFWGYPSYYYNYWYYNWPGYYYRYPYYSYYYGSYYYGRYQPGFNYRGGPYYPGYGRVVYPKTYPWHRGNPAWQNSRGQPTMGANPRRPAPVGSGQRQPTAISPRQEFRGGAPGTKPVPHIERVRSPERVRTSDVAPVRSTDRSFQPASRSNRPVMETSNFRSTTPTRAPSSGFQPRGGGGSFRSFGGMGPSRSGGSFGGGGRHR
jgi:uncharacterized membrane protein YgcG